MTAYTKQETNNYVMFKFFSSYESMIVALIGWCIMTILTFAGPVQKSKKSFGLVFFAIYIFFAVVSLSIVISIWNLHAVYEPHQFTISGNAPTWFIDGVRALSNGIETIIRGFIKAGPRLLASIVAVILLFTPLGFCFNKLRQ